MLVAAAVCPCPPLLVPAVASGAAPELDTLRASCRAAVEALAAARPDRLIVVGTGPGPGAAYPSGSRGSFEGFGVPLTVHLGTRGGEAAVTGEARGATAAPSDLPPPPSPTPPTSLPTSLAIAAWLLADVGWDAAPVSGVGLPADQPTADCLARGRELDALDGRTALLVMGDGSHCRGLRAPGYLDERGAPFDADIAAALKAADHQALAALDRDLAAEVGAVGAAPWQVLAGAAGDGGLAGRLLHDEAPYGVGYLVSVWS
ncbi:hypothetical protein [Streptomyces sp. SM14]|uniref:hypothetical protein n=2 Tax=unclassified Streptomyces TaxID=2593676 RepID=UPI000CD4E519|nr:hypothetical protein [Streptomyces sp. SM14]